MSRAVRAISPGRVRRGPDGLPLRCSLLLILILCLCHDLHPRDALSCSAHLQDTFSFIPSQFSSGSMFYLQPTGPPTAVTHLCCKSSDALQQKELRTFGTIQQRSGISICRFVTLLAKARLISGKCKLKDQINACVGAAEEPADGYLLHSAVKQPLKQPDGVQGTSHMPSNNSSSLLLGSSYVPSRFPWPPQLLAFNRSQPSTTSVSTV